MYTVRKHAVRRPGWLPFVAAVGVLLTLPAPAVAQQVESPEKAMLGVTSTSETATDHFWAGMNDFENIHFLRGANHLQRALEVDPNLGLARVLYGWGAPGLTSTQRTSEITRGIGTMGEATTGELILATALKEWNANNNQTARDLLAIAAEMYPADPHVAYLHAFVPRQGANAQQAGLMAMRKVTERFPDFAAAHNILGYGLWNAGDRDGAMQTLRRYTELAPNHPNPHDSYAEILQWDGRYDAAARHYRKAIELDADYTAGYTGLAEVYQLQGKGSEAIAQLTTAIEHTPTPQARLNTRRALANAYWVNGDRKRAKEHLMIVAEQATTQQFNGIARNAHYELAVLDAVDKGRNIATHLDAAAGLNGAGTPAQHAWTATAYAVVGNVDMAREAAQQLAKAAESAPGWKTPSLTSNAMIFLLEDRVADAMRELEQANPQNNMVRALSAECYARMGNKAEAQAFKADVLQNRQLNFFSTTYPVAAYRAAKVK